MNVADGRMVCMRSDLADEVLPLIRSSGDLHRYRAANEHGYQMHEAVDILEEAVGVEDASVVHDVCHRALSSSMSMSTAPTMAALHIGAPPKRGSLMGRGCWCAHRPVARTCTSRQHLAGSSGRGRQPLRVSISGATAATSSSRPPGLPARTA